MPFLLAELGLWLAASAAAGLVLGLVLGRPRRAARRAQTLKLVALRSAAGQAEARALQQRQRADLLVTEVEEMDVSKARIATLEAQVNSLRTQLAPAPSAPLTPPPPRLPAPGFRSRAY